jgi:hypothetical protein
MIKRYCEKGKIVKVKLMKGRSEEVKVNNLFYFEYRNDIIT